MKTNQISLANKIYLILAGLFITSLVASNLIFTKIFYWYPFDINFMGVKLFELSVGFEEAFTGSSYSSESYKRAIMDKFFLNNSDIEEIENQVIIYQPQRIIVDQE